MMDASNPKIDEEPAQGEDRSRSGDITNLQVEDSEATANATASSSQQAWQTVVGDSQAPSDAIVDEANDNGSMEMEVEAISVQKDKLALVVESTTKQVSSSGSSTSTPPQSMTKAKFKIKNEYPPTAPAHFSFSQRWTSAIDNFRVIICRGINVISHHAATHPWTYTVGIPILSLAMIAIGFLTNFNVVVDSNVLWPPKGSTTQIHQHWIEEESRFRKAPHYAVLHVHADGDNILGQESIAKTFEVFDAILALPDYDAICDEPRIDPDTNATETCYSEGVLDFWRQSIALYDEKVETDQDVIIQMSADRFPSGRVVDPYRIFGTPVYDGNTGLLTSVLAYRVEMLFPTSDEAYDFIKDIIDTVKDYQEKWKNDDSNIKVETFTVRSFNDEFNRAIIKDTPLLPIAFFVMSAFCSIVFMKRDRVKSQALLGVGAAVSIFFAVCTGYGFLFAIGQPLTSGTQLIIFVMFGIGLDDAFIISGSFFRTDPSKDVVQRVSDSIQDIGLSITLTTLTSALAFAVGCMSKVRGVFWMCLFAWPTIIIIFFYQITFFVALIVIDDRRMKRNKMDVLVCITVKNRNVDDDDNKEYNDDSDINNDETIVEVTNNSRISNTKLEKEEEEEEAREVTINAGLSSRFMAWYADKLLQPWTKVAVLALFSAVLGVCIYGTTQMRQEMDFKDLVPSDSYIKSFFHVFDTYSPDTGTTAHAYFRFIHQSDPAVREQMGKYLDDLVAAEAINGDPPYFWARDFDNFMNQLKEGDFDDIIAMYNAGELDDLLATANDGGGDFDSLIAMWGASGGSINTTALTFAEQMDIFLAHPVYNTLYKDMIVRDPVSGDVEYSRTMIFLDVDHGDPRSLIDRLDLLRDISGSQPLNQDIKHPGDWAMFTHTDHYNTWEFFSVAINELIFTTVVAVVSVSVIGMALIPHWTAILFVLPSIITVYIDLLGFLYFVGVRISALSYITLVMAIGLLVDFVMHVLLRYYECRGSREERVKETLRTMGSSILLGGISTFLGVLMLAFSTSTVFNTIFRAFAGIVILGIAYGLILLPVVLSMVGPCDEFVGHHHSSLQMESSSGNDDGAVAQKALSQPEIESPNKQCFKEKWSTPIDQLLANMEDEVEV